jgi:CDGSH-type Zn-finger protein
MSAGFNGAASVRRVTCVFVGGEMEWLCRCRTSEGSPYWEKTRHFAWV